MPTPSIVYAPIMDAEVRAIADELRPGGFEFRNVAPSDLPEALMDADYLCGFIGPIDPDVLVAAASRRLKLVQLMSAGYDRFNIEGARLARLPVADNGGANAIAVAEHAIMLMLSAMKHVHALDAAVRRGAWRGGVGRVLELYGSTVGIVGMGRIGREVAKIATDHPLLEFSNVILTPHSAGPTWQSFPRRFANCFANIERVQRGERPLWVVEELADLFPM